MDTSWTSGVVDSDRDGAGFLSTLKPVPTGWCCILPEFVWSFRLPSLIKQTCVVVCKGGRCAGDTHTAGEVITLAAGRVC